MWWYKVCLPKLLRSLYVRKELVMSELMETHLPGIDSQQWCPFDQHQRYHNLLCSNFLRILLWYFSASSLCLTYWSYLVFYLTKDLKRSNYMEHKITISLFDCNWCSNFKTYYALILLWHIHYGIFWWLDDIFPFLFISW